MAYLGGAENKGIEIETTFFPVESIVLNASISYLDAKISEAPSGVPISVGDSLPRVPEWTAFFGAEYRWDLTLADSDFAAFARVDFRYVDDRISVIGNPDTVASAFQAPSYNSTNFRIGLESEKWYGGFYINNVFDQEIVYDSVVGVFADFITEGTVGRPRTLGVNAGLRF